MAISLTSSDVAVINQFVGDLGNTSTADAYLLQQISAVTVTVDAVFDTVLDASGSVDILNAFHITSNDVGSRTADIAVAMASGSRANAFKAALSRAIVQAAGGVATQIAGEAAAVGNQPASTNINTYFGNVLYADVDAKLEADGFSGLLQAGRVNSVNASVLNDSGAASMYDVMNVDDAAAAVKRRAIALQIDEAHLQTYWEAFNDVSNSEFLPMKGGQTMTFLFNCDMTGPSTVTLIPQGPSPNGGGYTLTGSALNSLWAPGTISGSNTMNDKKKIAIIVHLGDKDAYFPMDLSQELIAVDASTDFKYYQQKYASLERGLTTAAGAAPAASLVGSAAVVARATAFNNLVSVRASAYTSAPVIADPATKRPAIA